ncbi:UNVERIFIED_ORG: type IV secretory pathway VirB10-like protein [Arthrobacter sp. UYCu721]
MIRSSSVLRAVSAAAATAVLALLVGLSAAAPVKAEGETPSSNCGLICLDDKRGPKETPTPSPTQTSSAPAIEPPAPPPAPVAPAPTFAPELSVSPAGQTPSAVPSTTIPSPASSAAPSTESNWNKPITKSAKPTQAAAVSRNDGSGLFGGPGLLAIMGGVLLLGVAGLAFAWWSRNRLASH